MTAAELEAKIYYAIRFIVKRQAIPDTIVMTAADAAAREISKYQKQVDSRTEKENEIISQNDGS